MDATLTTAQRKRNDRVAEQCRQDPARRMQETLSPTDSSQFADSLSAGRMLLMTIGNAFALAFSFACLAL